LANLAKLANLANFSGTGGEGIFAFVRAGREHPEPAAIGRAFLVGRDALRLTSCVEGLFADTIWGEGLG
jgi:hypothetical protein